MTRRPFLLPLVLFAATALPGATLRPQTLRAFDRYIASAEARIQQRIGGRRSFLWLGEEPEREAIARRGEVVVSHPPAGNMIKVPGGLIHDWIGGTFIAGVTLPQVLALMQDYDHHQQYYAPEVMASRLLARHGNDFLVFYRLKKKRIITVVLDTEHRVHYAWLGAKRCYSRSVSTRVTQVKHPGSPQETDLPVGQDGGYLWRLNSYWRFAQQQGGVYVELEAISLSRSIPFGFGWLVKPVVAELPRASLVATLVNTRRALEQRTAARGGGRGRRRGP